MSEIIDIQTKQAIIQTEPCNFSMCSCRTIVLVSKTREVKCPDCGTVYDAFGWLQKFGRYEGQLLQRIEHLEQEAKKRAERVEELQKTEQTLKSRIRAAKNRFVDSTLDALGESGA